MVGRISLILGLLLFCHGALLNAPQAAAQAEHASPAKFAKAPVPRISVSPTGMLADINGKSADDLTLHCSIDGDLSQVSKAWVEITDGPHGKVLFTQPVPIQPTCDVIWPRGQPMETTPNEIYFQVRNSDDAVSNSVRADSEYALPDDDPTPILSSITPRLMVKGVNVSARVTGHSEIDPATGRRSLSGWPTSRQITKTSSTKAIQRQFVS